MKAVLIPLTQESDFFGQLFDNSFYKEAYKRFSKHPWTKYYIGLEIFSTIICSIISSYFMIKISEGENRYVLYQIILTLMTLVIDQFVVQILSREIGYNAMMTFIKDSNLLYSQVHFEERANKTADGARIKKDSAKYSFEMVCEWGIPTFIGLIGNGLSVIFTFFVKGMILQFLFCSVCGFLFYYFYIKAKQDSFTKYDKDVRKYVQRIYELIRLKTISFQGGETTHNEMTNMEKDVETNQYEKFKKWTHISTMVSFANSLTSMVIIVFSTSNFVEHYFSGKKLNMFNTTDYMLFSIVLLQWSNSISGATNFMTRLNGMKSDYDNFVDYWKDTRFMDEPEKLELTPALQITSYNINRGKMTFKFENPSTIIPFNIGRKFLVLGPTGHGKSTFVNAILGKIDGMGMNIGSPSNYHHHAADMFQAIREKMPSSKITIRDWFKGELDDEFIKRILLITIEPKKVEEIMENFSKREKDKHPFDVEINEEISGGQKTALCLATRCYEIEKFNKKVLVLDEPEQGLGRRAVKVLNNIYRKYPDITIINSTHLYKFELVALECKFDMIFWIVNGTVKIYKSFAEIDFLDSLEYE
jgi:ABC-type transport system involved in cytochrome bd biosynthesis fused ATPase/permease subunit